MAVIILPSAMGKSRTEQGRNVPLGGVRSVALAQGRGDLLGETSKSP